jgi:hypothetical protein
LAIVEGEEVFDLDVAFDFDELLSFEGVDAHDVGVVLHDLADSELGFGLSADLTLRLTSLTPTLEHFHASQLVGLTDSTGQVNFRMKSISDFLDCLDLGSRWGSLLGLVRWLGLRTFF